MASQSALRARVATIRELLAPDTSRQPCVTVRINREPPHQPRGPLLLTAGEEPGGEESMAEIQSPAKPAEARKRDDGHVCSPRCVSVSINFTVRPSALDSDAEPRALPPVHPAAPRAPGSGYGDDAVGAPSGRDRGDVQCLPESAAAGRDVEPQSGPPRSSPPVYAPDVGAGEVVLGGRARDAVVEVERTAPPALVSPLEIEGRQEAASVSRALWHDVMLGLPWWLPVEQAPLGLCAVPHCGHPAAEHRGIRERLPCRACGFRAEQHDPDGIALEVPQYARRVSPCSLYRAICVDEIDSDKCDVTGCACRGWRRWLPLDPRSELMVLQAQIAERDRIIADNEQKLARLKAEMEAAERELFRATSGPNDLGASPHGCPVYTEGESA